jgi:hypothetical protein
VPLRRQRPDRRPAEEQRDWIRFLWETEDRYWQTMQRFLKDELKVRGVVVGTIVGCSPPNLQARLDAIDTHAYWQHPKFPPGKGWDPVHWTVGNKSMVNEAGGILPGLALRRVRGKPHLVTEYNHSAPNTYSAEAFPLLAAYAALQDWDAVFPFAYSHNGDWNSRKISGFFDIDQHPVKMATLPAAVAMFQRGDVAPAKGELLAALPTERQIELLLRAGPWEQVHAGTVGLPREAALVHRVGLAADGQAGPFERPAGPKYVADSGELTWDRGDPKRGVVTVAAARSKAVIGYGGGRRFDLGGGVVAEPGPAAQDGWSVLTLTAVEGEIAAGPARLLVAAAGLAENTAMGWTSPAKESVSNTWGKPPSLVEGVPARLTLPRPAARVRAWALDERGRRRDAVPVSGGDVAVIELGPKWHTLWYEVELR